MNETKLIKWVAAMLLVPILVAAGCKDRYRYECHDPDNWETERCQKPKCELHRDCPDMIFKNEKERVGNNGQFNGQNKNVCCTGK